MLASLCCSPISSAITAALWPMLRAFLRNSRLHISRARLRKISTTCLFCYKKMPKTISMLFGCRIIWSRWPIWGLMISRNLLAENWKRLERWPISLGCICLSILLSSSCSLQRVRRWHRILLKISIYLPKFSHWWNSASIPILSLMLEL